MGFDPKYSAGFGKTQNFRGFDRYSGGGIRQNLGTRCGIGKENGIWDRGDRSSGCRIVIETGSDPPSTLPDPVPMAGVSSKARSGHIYFMDDNLQHAVSKLRYKGSSKRGGRLREVEARGVRV